MFGLNKDTPVVGKSYIKVQSPCKKVFNFVGANFIKNYPKWSPEVVDLESLTEGSIKEGTMCRQVRIDQGRRPGTERTTDNGRSDKKQATS